MFGGQSNQTNFLSDTWIFEDLNGWKQVSTDFPSARVDQCGCSTSHGVYIFGGKLTDNLTNEIYRFTNNKWSLINTKNAPSPRFGHMCVCTENSLISFGGKPNAIVNETWILDFNTNNWRMIQNTENNSTHSYPSARMWHSQNIIGNGMYVFGGLTSCSKDTPSSELWYFNLKNESWSLIQAPNPPLPRSGQASFVIGQNLYILGGELAHEQFILDIFQFNPILFQWTQLNQFGKMSDPVVGGKVSMISESKAIYFGGAIKFPIQTNNLTFFIDFEN